MPLHLNSITNDTRKAEPIAWLLQKGMDDCDSVFATKDQKYFHIRRKIMDRLSGDAIGRIVYTIMHGERVLEIKDLDIVWNNDTPTRLQFNTLRDKSSDANEYYEAETVEAGQHLELETVDRHVVSADILNTEREAFISAFPFELNVYADIHAFNEWAGFDRVIAVADTDLKVSGFSERFIMPGGLFKDKKKNGESYSFLIGKVISYRDVEIAFGETVYPFVLAQVDTALGVIPVSMGREVFDLEELQVGCIVAMNADIKADMAKDEDFTYPNR